MSSSAPSSAGRLPATMSCIASRCCSTTLRGDAQAHHAERVGDAAQRFHLRLQVGDAGLLGAQVQVERVLDAQQVFLDRGGDGVEQRAVAAAQAAARMREFGFGRQLRGEVEGVAQRVERAVRLLVVGDVVQQLARSARRRVRRAER